MQRQAQVTAIAELGAFRASLLVYLSQAARVLDDLHQQVITTRLWLQSDRRVHWQQQIRKRTQLLAQAEQELFTARLSAHPAAVQDRRRSVERARRALTEAEERLARVKSWLRHYESQVEARLRPVTRLRQILAGDMKKAAAYLDQTGNLLAEYADLTPKPASPTPGVDGTPRPPSPMPKPEPPSPDAKGTAS